MSNKRIYQEIAKIVTTSSNASEYLEHFYSCVKNLRKSKNLDKELARVKTRQSQLGKELTMLNIERIAIMAVKESK